MFFFAPPPIIHQIDAPLFDFEHFKATRVHPKSDPELMTALNRLYADCPSFRDLLASFEKEQPTIHILLIPMERNTLGSLKVDKIANGYLITVYVQNKFTRLGLDSREPWLGSILFALLEITRKDGVFGVSADKFIFTNEIETCAWNFQQKIRSELNRANQKPKLKLAKNGEVMAGFYWKKN